jgi:hypothetical protein
MAQPRRYAAALRKCVARSDAAVNDARVRLGLAESGVATFLQTSNADDDASFVGVERVTGSIGANSGTFVLQDQGTVKGSTVSGSWFVVPGSGTGSLRGLRGEAGFTAELGQRADITLDYWFE